MVTDILGLQGYREQRHETGIGLGAGMGLEGYGQLWGTDSEQISYGVGEVGSGGGKTTLIPVKMEFMLALGRYLKAFVYS